MSDKAPPINGGERDPFAETAVEVQAHVKVLLETRDARLILHGLLVNASALAVAILEAKKMDVGDITGEFTSALLDTMQKHSAEKPRIMLLDQ